ncbi:glycosyltransferase [Bacillus paranthracis]
MARVLFINTGSEGHINPTLQVVEELVSRGEEVVYFSIEAFRERIEKTGAIVRTIDDQKFIKSISFRWPKLFAGKNKWPSTYSRCYYTKCS